MAVDPLSKVFAALGDPIRRDLVVRLADGDATVQELAARHAVSTQAVWKHLKVLEDAGLVSRDDSSPRRPAHLEAEVFDLMTKWIERYRRNAEQRYRRLDDVLAAMPDEDGSIDSVEINTTTSNTTVKSKTVKSNTVKSKSSTTKRPRRAS